MAIAASFAFQREISSSALRDFFDSIGQTAKNSPRAYVFRLASELGHCSARSHLCIRKRLMRCNKIGAVSDYESGVQLIEQRLGLLQIERVEAFGEPAVDRSEKIAGLIPLALIAPEPRHAHRGAQFPGLCLLLHAQPRARARNTLPLSPHPAPATSARFRRRCDGPRPRTIFPWLFPPPSSLRQCSAKRHRIGRAPHRRSPNMISTSGINNVAPVDRYAVIPEVIISNCVRGFAGQGQNATLVHHSERLPEHGAFFVRQSDKFIGLRVCCRVISAEDMGERRMATAHTSTWRLDRSRAHP